MLGFIAALGYEIVSGKSLKVQFAEAPVLIAATFVLIIVASLVRPSSVPINAAFQIVLLILRGCFNSGYAGKEHFDGRLA